MTETGTEVTILQPQVHTRHGADKKVRLSMQALQEYDKRMGHLDKKQEKSQSSLKTDSSPPLSSLYGADLSIRALQITRRLSRSVYLDKTKQQRKLSTCQQGHKVQYKNTFKTGPDDDTRFQQEKVKQIIKKTLDLHLNGKVYDAVEGSRQSVIIANSIKERVKALEMPRFKVVTNVFIGQMSKQGVQISSRCVWDTNEDNFATCRFENSSLYAVATVYGIYFQ